MKKLFTLMVVASLALTIQAQDITNELGSGGHFYLKNSNSQTMFDFENASSSYYRFFNTGTESTIFQIHNAGHNCKLEFRQSNGTASNPTNVNNGIGLGEIYARGYHNGGYRLGAAITFMVNTSLGGSISSAGIPTDIIFETFGGGISAEKRFVIQTDGKVGVGDIDPNSTLQVDGSMSMPVESGTAPYTLTEKDYTYITNNSSAHAADVTLPSAVGIKGRVYIIKNTGSGEQSVLPQTGESIDSGSDYKLSQGKFVKVQSDGSNWIVIGESNY